MNNRHLWQLKESKSWEPFRSYQLNSTANSAHLAKNWAKLAKWAVLFRWQLLYGSQDFDSFNCHRCRLFISCEIHCYFCPHIFWVYYFSLSQCVGDATGAENNMSWGPFLNYVIMFLPISYQLSTTTLVSVSTKYGLIWVLSFQRQTALKKVYLVCTTFCRSN